MCTAVEQTARIAVAAARQWWHSAASAGPARLPLRTKLQAGRRPNNRGRRPASAVTKLMRLCTKPLPPMCYRSPTSTHPSHLSRSTSILLFLKITRSYFGFRASFFHSVRDGLVVGARLEVECYPSSWNICVMINIRGDAW